MTRERYFAQQESRKYLACMSQETYLFFSRPLCRIRPHGRCLRKQVPSFALTISRNPGIPWHSAHKKMLWSMRNVAIGGCYSWVIANVSAGKSVASVPLAMLLAAELHHVPYRNTLDNA